MFIEGILLGVEVAIGLCVVAVFVAGLILIVVNWFAGENKRGG